MSPKKPAAKFDEKKWFDKVVTLDILKKLVQTETKELVEDDTIRMTLLDWKLPAQTTSALRKIQVSWRVKQTPCSRTFLVKHLAHLTDINTDLNVFLRGIFIKEIYVVKNVLPRLNEALRSVGLKEIDHPVYHFTRVEKNEEIIIMEDLTRTYSPIRPPASLNEVHLDLVISNLARFHASSLIVEKQEKRKLEEVFPGIIETWNTDVPRDHQFIRDILAAQTTGLIQLLGVIPGDWRKVINWLTDNVIKNFRVRALAFPRGQMNTVTHGDLWTNNMLFSYDVSGIPKSVKFIDFQICRKSSPVCDILYFFFTSLRAERRRAVTSTYLNNYHESFKRNLKKAGITWDFTESNMTEEYNLRSGIGLFSCLSIYPVMYKNEDTVETLVELCERDPRARENMVAALEDVEEMGVFDKPVNMESNIVKR